MLDGKTDPYATDSSLSDEQITETLEWFKENGLTRTSKIQKRSFLTYNIDLFRIKPTATKRILARILNFVLIILFVPALIGGIITAINMPNLADVDAIQQFIGLIIGAIPPVLLGLLQGTTVMLQVIFFYIIVQQVDGHFVMPKLMGSIINVHPVAIIAGVLIGGKIFGVLGMMIAVPLVAVLQILLKHMWFYDRYKKVR